MIVVPYKTFLYKLFTLEIEVPTTDQPETSPITSKRILGFVSSKYENVNRLWQSFAPDEHNLFSGELDILDRKSELSELPNVDLGFS